MYDTVNSYLKKCILDVMNTIFTALAEILFKPGALPEVFQTILNFFVGFVSIFLVVMVLFKVLQYIWEESEGRANYTIGQIIAKSVKASVMIVIAPIVLNIIVSDIVYPINTKLFSTMAEGMANITQTFITTAGINGFSYILLLLLVTIAIGVFAIKICRYHAEIIVATITCPWACISLMADDNNYFGVWWKGILNLATTMVVQTALIAGIMGILGAEFTWYNFMLLIGCCCLLIKPPEMLKGIWMSTGTGKAVASGGVRSISRFIAK